MQPTSPKGREYLHTSVNTTSPTQLPTYSDRLYEQQFSLNIHLYNIVLPPLVTTVFTSKPTGGTQGSQHLWMDDSPTHNDLNNALPPEVPTLQTNRYAGTQVVPVQPTRRKGTRHTRKPTSLDG